MESKKARQIQTSSTVRGKTIRAYTGQQPQCARLREVRTPWRTKLRTMDQAGSNALCRGKNEAAFSSAWRKKTAWDGGKRIPLGKNTPSYIHVHNIGGKFPVRNRTYRIALLRGDHTEKVQLKKNGFWPEQIFDPPINQIPSNLGGNWTKDFFAKTTNKCFEF